MFGSSLSGFGLQGSPADLQLEAAAAPSLALLAAAEVLRDSPLCT